MIVAIEEIPHQQIGGALFGCPGLRPSAWIEQNGEAGVILNLNASRMHLAKSR
jgi:hypothetical protein